MTAGMPSKPAKLAPEIRPRVDILVIGAMRAGTTAFDQWLSSIPDISTAKMKETDFFIAEKNFPRGDRWYQDQFTPTAKLRVDVSPNYSKRDIFAGVPERVHASNPDAKIIFIARDPVKRAISHYAHSFLSGQAMPSPSELSKTEIGQHIINTSRYDFQLQAWWDYFAREKIHIICFEDLVKNQNQASQQLADFLTLPKTTFDGLPFSRQMSNSRDELAALPQWWMTFRKSPLGQQLRSMADSQFKQNLKKFVSGRNKPALPEFSAYDIHSLTAALAEDTALFRQHTGMKFEGWCL